MTPDSECRFFFHSAGAFDFTQIDELTAERSPDASSVPVDQLDFATLESYDGVADGWGDADAGPHGSVIRLDAGGTTGEVALRNAFSLVPIVGELELEADDQTQELEVGSLLEAEANTVHQLGCDGSTDCLFYLFSDGPRDISRS